MPSIGSSEASRETLDRTPDYLSTVRRLFATACTDLQPRATILRIDGATKTSPTIGGLCNRKRPS